MRKRSLLTTNIVEKPIEEANYADICFYDKENDNKIIVPYSQISSDEYPLTRYTPIGIVAVPSSHTDEGRPRIVSLAEMSYDTPDSGQVNSDEYARWGGYTYTVTDLPFKQQYPYLSNLSEDGKVNYTPYFCYLPSDAFSGRTENPLNSLEGFYSTHSYNMCSPYKEDGSKEPRYFDISNTGNVLADFDGKSNTEKILAVDNSYSTAWQKASKISNIYRNQYIHPAAQCCWRYHTDGTKQGEWYLPSAGELGYAVARKGSINLAINTINTQYSTTLGFELDPTTCWSSTQYPFMCVVYLDFHYGDTSFYDKIIETNVRAFLIV